MHRAGRALYYPNSTYVFLALAVLAVAGFWPDYIAVLSDASIHTHVHGIAMSAWLVLLIVQAGLIRRDARDVHRRLGLVS